MEKLPIPAASASQEEHTQPQRSNLITAIGNRIRGNKAYNQAKQEFKSAWDEVATATYESTHDEEGNWLPDIPYTAGLHLKSHLTEKEHQQFLEEYYRNVSEAFPEGEIIKQLVSGPDLKPQLSARAPGRLYDDVFCSAIGLLPDVQYNQTFMSEKQIADLEHERRSLYHYGSMSVRVELNAIGERRSSSLQNPPEVLRMDNEPTHALVIQSNFTHGYRRQEEVAKQILDCITQTSVMQDKLPPVEVLPQLPAGE